MLLVWPSASNPHHPTSLAWLTGSICKAKWQTSVRLEPVLDAVIQIEVGARSRRVRMKVYPAAVQNNYENCKCLTTSALDDPTNPKRPKQAGSVSLLNTTDSDHTRHSDTIHQINSIIWYEILGNEWLTSVGVVFKRHVLITKVLWSQFRPALDCQIMLVIIFGRVIGLLPTTPIH